MRFTTSIVALSSLFSVATAACSFQPKEGVGLSGTGSTSGTGSGIDAAANVDRVYTNQDLSNVLPSDACPANTFTANNLPPDLLIVLDRSGSMDESADGSCKSNCGAMSKWSQITTAINGVVGTTQDKVRWGLKMFASPGGQGSNSCTVNGNAEVAPNLNTATMIATAITNGNPGSRTPTRAAETQAAAYLKGNPDVNPKYILLATDGLPNCKEGAATDTADDPAAIAAVAAVAGMGIPTFVIGIATNGSTADGTLNMMAVNGGHPRAGSPQYYPVASTAELSDVLKTIQGMVALPCQFQLPGVPSNTGAVGVSVGGQPVPASAWGFGPGNRSIVFPDAGSVCMQLKNGTAKDVVITLPCGETIIP